MENKLLKVGNEVYFTSHTHSGLLTGRGIGIIGGISSRDYLVRYENKTYCVTIPGMRTGGWSKDTISLIEEEN